MVRYVDWFFYVVEDALVGFVAYLLACCDVVVLPACFVCVICMFVAVIAVVVAWRFGSC